jgi:hypothetical protein
MMQAARLPDGRVGVVPYEHDLTDGERVKLLARQAEQQKIKLLSPIDHGQDVLRKHMSDPAWFGLAGRSAVVMTDEYAVLVSRQTGLYWIFSLKNASLKKTGSIFKKMTPEMLAEGDLFQGHTNNPIICVNPEKDGNVLISAEDESFFLTEKGDLSKEANEIWQNMPEPKTQQDFIKIYYQKEKELFDRNPYIVWYRLYPENGKIERLSVPPEGGTLFRNDTRGTWRPMPDGSVKMGHIEIREVEKKAVQSDSTLEATDRLPQPADPPPQTNADVKNDAVVNKYSQSTLKSSCLSKWEALRFKAAL